MTQCKLLETSPNSLRVILVKLEDHQSVASHKMTQYGKHGTFRGFFLKVLKLIPYQVNYISNDPPTDGEVYFDHLEQFGISFKTLKKYRGRFLFFQIVSY